MLVIPAFSISGQYLANLDKYWPSFNYLNLVCIIYLITKRCKTLSELNLYLLA